MSTENLKLTHVLSPTLANESSNDKTKEEEKQNKSKEVRM